MQVTVRDELLKRAEMYAIERNLSLDAVFEQALQAYLPDNHPPARIHQGDVYWLRHDESPDIAHPQLVVQADVLNHSRIDTVVVCALTTNMKKVNMPGNVLLDDGEANLSKRSVVEVAKVSTVKKSQLGEYIGSVDEARIRQIFDGMRFVQESFLNR